MRGKPASRSTPLATSSAAAHAGSPRATPDVQHHRPAGFAMASRLDRSHGTRPTRTRDPIAHRRRPDHRPREAARLRDRRPPGGRRPLRAARAAAHRGRRDRRPDRPAPRPAAPEHLPRAGQARGGQGAGRGGRREPHRGRRRAVAAPGPEPRGADGDAGHRPDRDHPRHLRRARAERGGQAPGRARPARVQPRADARPVDAPRASRRRARRGRHRDPRPGRVPARDRPPPRARPDLGPAAQAARREGLARGHARRARARPPAAGRARRLHERRQVDAAQPAHGLDRRRARPAVPHARPEHPRDAPRRPSVPHHRHGRLHPQAAPPARRRVRRDARGDAPRRPDRPRRRRLGGRGRDGR